MPDEKDVISNLRAIIISSKGGLPLVNVQNDYLEAFGERVPLKSLGYSNLRDLFEKNSSDFRVFGDKVDALEKSSSAHIKSLVNRQKNKTKPLRNIKTQVSSRARQSEAHHALGSSNRRQKPEPIPRFTKDIDKFISKNINTKSTTKGDSFKTITLREPRVRHNTDQKKPSGILQKNTAPLNKETPSFENLRKSKKGTTTGKNTNHSITEGSYAESFEDAKDLPQGKGAQSRLLRNKYKVSLDQEPDVSLSHLPKSSTWLFDPESISSSVTLMGSLSLNHPVSESVSDEKISWGEHLPNVPLVRQNAQARIANIKSSMKSLLMNENTLMGGCNKESAPFPKLSTSQTSVTDEIRGHDIVEKEESNFDFSRKKLRSQYQDSSTDPNGVQEEILNATNFLSGSYQSGQSRMSKDAGGGDCNVVTNISQQNISDTEYVIKLRDLCNVRKLSEPSYKIIIIEPKNERKHYICKVHIKDYMQVSSYPIETLDPYSAKEIAAKKMYNYIVIDENLKYSPSEDAEEIVPRILEIVSPTYGIWSDKLPILYKEYYNRDISENWFNVIMKTSLFEIDKFDGHRFIIRKRVTITESNNRVKAAEKAEEPQLAKLQLPDFITWEVYITNIINADEIWCRLIGENYSDAYDSMMTRLELEAPENKARDPRPGRIYIIKVSAINYRVKLLELKSESQALVFYIDVGDKDIVDVSELYEPEEIYFSVAPQAVMLSLHELGSFSDDEELTSVITDYILGNTYIAEIIKESQELTDTKQIRRIVRLWDTSTELDVNVNQVLLNKIIKNISTPSLPNTAQIKEAIVSSVNNNGDVYIQTNKKSVHHLKCLIFNKIKSLEGNFMNQKTNDIIGTDILYLAKCDKNDIFYRAKVIEIHTSATVEVLFVDLGSIMKIAISDLIRLEKSSILQAIPAQALKVKLANMNFSLSIVDKLREIVLNQSVLIKVVASDRGRVPSVEIFKRSSVDNTLYSVNMKLSSNSEIKASEVPARRKSIVIGLENVLPRDLPAPYIPPIGEHFQVFVTSASSPDLFIVQPIESRVHLMKMMNELQTLCSESRKTSTLEPDIEIGGLYAVLHPDGHWYRGCVQVAVGAYNYSVYLCDFGDCVIVTRDKLLPLLQKYKTFPYQAVRAKLLGIPPDQRDWTSVDCTNFYKLVVEKRFVSVVIEINTDKKNLNYVNLGLILTDTTGEEDIYIHEVLLDKRNEEFSLMKSNC